MNCYLCGDDRNRRLPGKVRDDAALHILECVSCGLVYLSNRDSAVPSYYEEEYTDEQHGAQTWREYLNECRDDDERRANQILPYVSNKRYLDVGCGAGGVLLAVRERCVEVMGVEPQKRWRPELEKQGLEIVSSIDDLGDKRFDVVSLFHVLEHVSDPLPFLAKLRMKLKPGGLLFIEVPSSDNALLQLYESKPFSEFTYWSPHVILYNARTLGMLVQKAGLTDVNIQQFQRYPLSNHLMWLSKGVAGGHREWAYLDSPELKSAYAAALASVGKCDTLIAHVRSPS